MWTRLASVLGILAAVACLGIATTYYPGGFDWSKDFISTLLRGHSGPARNWADAGVVIFCVSLALVYNRLSLKPEFSKQSKMIQIGGIGSMVYSAFAMTPLHDTVVTISIAFALAAVIPIIFGLRANRERGFFIFGCISLGIFAATACFYYAGIYAVFLPWGQRASYALFAIWLVAMDFSLPRGTAREVSSADAHTLA